MSTRRVILGNLGGGTYGLRVSLPGHDVVSEGGNSDALSFDSGWTDIIKMIQVGVLNSFAPYDPYSDVLFPDVGYPPFIEVRFQSGLRAYDDYNPTSTDGFPGLGANIKNDRFQLWSIPSGHSVVYAIFRVPVPAP